MSRLPVDLFPLPASSGGSTVMVLAVLVGLAVYLGARSPATANANQRRQAATPPGVRWPSMPQTSG